jgi:hypothetical protein
MKASTYLTSLTAAMLVFASGTLVAQGQRGGQQQGGQQGGQQQGAQQQQQQRQAERAMSQDRVMDQERLQTRERDRTQDREQAQDRTHAAAGPAEGIYGGNLMTVQERNQYRSQLGGLQTEQERNEFKARHSEQMQLRSKERGIDPQVTTD